MTLYNRPNDLLLLIGKALAVLMQILMVIAAFFLVLGAGALVVFSADIAAEVAAEFGSDVSAFPAMAVAGIMLLAIVMVAGMYFFFDRLRRIIDTVGEGDPFLPENATRLNVMAWLLLGVQLLSIPIAGLALFLADWANSIEDIQISSDSFFDLPGILMVIVLFILARVFRIGAAMRDDLEGTV